MKWKKKGLLFSPNNRYDWMYSHAQTPNALVFHDFIRIYFTTREKYVNGQCRSFCAYIDVDRNDFSKTLRISNFPILTLGLPGTFDEFGTMPSSVIRINDQYYMYYCGWSRGVSVPHKEEIGVAISSDGLSFRRIASGPVLGTSLYEPYSTSYPIVVYIDGQYHMFYQSAIQWIKSDNRMEEQYLIRHAVSTDGINWKREYANIIPTLFPEESQTSPSVFYKDGRYHMFFCYRYSTDFRSNRERSYRIGYASSIDLKEWTRNDGNAGINVSASGWDSEMIAYPSVFTIDSKYYMLYCGNSFGKDGFGYAELCE